MLFVGMLFVVSGTFDDGGLCYLTPGTWVESECSAWIGKCKSLIGRMKSILDDVDALSRRRDHRSVYY